MKKFIDENIKANEEAIIRENNGPELRVKLYDNTGIDWLYHYGESSAKSLILIDDTVLHNLLDKADRKTIAKNASSKIYDIRIKNAVKENPLNLVIESVGAYKLGDDKNQNIVLSINDKVYKNQTISDKYFVLFAHKKREYTTTHKNVELTDQKPLRFLRRNLETFRKENADIYFTSDAMKKAFREDVVTKVTKENGEIEYNILNVKKEDIASVEFTDKLYKKSYIFTTEQSGEYWRLSSIKDFYAGNRKIAYRVNEEEYTTPTIVDCVENIYENL